MSVNPSLILIAATVLSSGICSAAHPLTGEYAYQDTSAVQARGFSNAMIDFTRVRPGSKIGIEIINGNAALIRYERTDGSRSGQLVDISHAGCEIDKTTITCENTMPDIGARILPGTSVQTRRVTFENDRKGNLRVVRNISESGWVFFLIPFSEDHETSFVLSRANDG